MCVHTHMHTDTQTHTHTHTHTHTQRNSWLKKNEKRNTFDSYEENEVELEAIT